MTHPTAATPREPSTPCIKCTVDGIFSQPFEPQEIGNEQATSAPRAYGSSIARHPTSQRDRLGQCLRRDAALHCLPNQITRLTIHDHSPCRIVYTPRCADEPFRRRHPSPLGRPCPLLGEDGLRDSTRPSTEPGLEIPAGVRDAGRVTKALLITIERLLIAPESERRRRLPLTVSARSAA